MKSSAYQTLSVAQKCFNSPYLCALVTANKHGSVIAFQLCPLNPDWAHFSWEITLGTKPGCCTSYQAVELEWLMHIIWVRNYAKVNIVQLDFGEGPTFCKFPFSGVSSSFTGRIEKPPSICSPLFEAKTRLSFGTLSCHNSLWRDALPGFNSAPLSASASITVGCYLTSGSSNVHHHLHHTPICVRLSNFSLQ